MAEYASKRGPLLTALTQAFPNGLSPDQVELHGGKNAQARIEELRRDGWEIKATLDPDTHRASYRLLSKTKSAPAVITAGLVIRHDTRSGWTVRTHQEALKGRISESVLRQAEQAALSAYKKILDAHLPAVAQAQEDDDGFDFGGFMEDLCGGGR